MLCFHQQGLSFKEQAGIERKAKKESECKKSLNLKEISRIGLFFFSFCGGWVIGEMCNCALQRKKEKYLQVLKKNVFIYIYIYIYNCIVSFTW